MNQNFNWLALRETQSSPGSTPKIWTDEKYCMEEGLPPEYAYNKELMMEYFISQQEDKEKGAKFYRELLAKNGLL